MKNSSWKNTRYDGKKMWNLIDWKGKAEKKKEILISDGNVDSYFKDIFQSNRTNNHPAIPIINYNYKSIVDIQKKCIIYNNLMDDEKLCLISRWRLSKHKLCIETGRYNNPSIPKDICNILEDEHHAIFICPAFNNIRMRFADLLNK